MNRVRLLAALASLVFQAGCGGGGSAGPEAPPTPATPTSNAAPLISGSPPTTVTAGSSLNFTPAASDANQDALSFSIQNKPSWATFNPASGQLSATASAADIGTFTGIVISVSDGKATTALPAFSLTVLPAPLNLATLHWTAPDKNTDGSALTDLVGYWIFEGDSASTLNRLAHLTESGATSYVTPGLSPGTHYFSVTAYTAAGIESEPSATVSKTFP